MEPYFSFQITPLDPDQMCSQVSRALEKRAELIARQKYPKMWGLTDKLNSVERVPQTVRENRRRRCGFLGLLNWLVGTILLMSGWVGPQRLWILLLVGGAGFGVGVVGLWHYKRSLLCILSLAVGAVLSLGALGAFQKLGGLLILGIADMAIGAAALLAWKQTKITPYDRAAAQLLQGKDNMDGVEEVHCSFSDQGMHIGLEEREDDMETIPYSNLELVLETEDLLLPVCGDSVMILQKKDLLFGTMPKFREFLSKKTHYVQVEEQQDTKRK